MSPQELRQAAAQRRRFAREARRAGRDSDTGAFAPHLSVVTCLAADDNELIWGPLVDVGEADSMDADLRDVLLSRGWREVSGGSGHDLSAALAWTVSMTATNCRTPIPSRSVKNESMSTSPIVVPVATPVRAAPVAAARRTARPVAAVAMAATVVRAARP
jgi:hypothetical protein